jgi:hypothetical protein
VYEIENIPSIPDQDERIEEITVGCYGQAKELSCISRGYRTDVLFG